MTPRVLFDTVRSPHGPHMTLCRSEVGGEPRRSAAAMRGEVRFHLWPDGSPLVDNSLGGRKGITARGLPAVAALRVGLRSKFRRLPLAGRRRARGGRCGLRRGGLESRYWLSRGFCVLESCFELCGSAVCLCVGAFLVCLGGCVRGLLSLCWGVGLSGAAGGGCPRHELQPVLPCTRLCEGLVF